MKLIHRLWRNELALMLTTPISLIVSLVLFGVMVWVMLSMQLRDIKQRMSHAGIALDAQQYIPSPVPDEDNVSLRIDEAVASVVNSSSLELKATDEPLIQINAMLSEAGFFGTLSAEDIARLPELVEPYQPALDILEEAFKRARQERTVFRARSNIDYDDPMISVNSPYPLEERVQLGNVLLAAAYLKESQNTVYADYFAQEAEKLMMYSDWMLDENFGLQTYALSLQSEFAAYKLILLCDDLYTKNNSLSNMIRFVKEKQNRLKFQYKIKQEFAFAIRVAGSSKAMMNTMKNGNEPKWIVPFSALFGMMSLPSFYEMAEAWLAASEEDFCYRQDGAFRFVAAKPNLIKLPAWGFMVQVAIPHPYPMFLRHEINRTVSRQYQLVQKLSRFKIKYDQYPDSLHELDLQNFNPADPFSGEDIKYKKKDKGYILYSVGPDFEDDGGWIDKEHVIDYYRISNEYDGDIVWETGQ